jgi:hypothetical protein
VLDAVPRQRFLPDLIWPHAADGGYVTVDRASDPDGWQRWADADVAIVTLKARIPGGHLARVEPGDRGARLIGVVGVPPDPLGWVTIAVLDEYTWLSQSSRSSLESMTCSA